MSITSPYARRLVELASDPVAGGGVRIYRNTLTGKVRVSNGTTWADVGGGASASYLVYRATLSQSGTSAPVATVLENTLGGSLVWSRSGAGSYRATKVGAFPTSSKIFLTHAGIGSNADFGLIGFTRVNSNQLNLQTMDVDLAGATVGAGDDLLSDTSIEILIYP